MKKTLYSLIITGTLCSLSAAIAIATVDANVREEPSINSEIVGVLRAGEDIEVIQKININNWPWYKTSRGYVSYDLLQLQDSKSIATKTSNSHAIKIYTQPSKDAQVVATLGTPYLDLSLAQDEKIIAGDDFPWYKTDKGWVEGSWIKGEYTPKPKPQNNTLLASDTKESSSNTQEQMPQVQEQPKEITLEESKKEVITEKPKEQQQKDPTTQYFVGVSLHYNTLSVTKKDTAGSIILNNKPDDTATSVGLHAGAKINNYILSANYEVVNLDDVKIQTTSLALDYQFDTILNPYIGISLGMSDLEWQIDPLVNSKMKDNKLSSLMYGLHVGVEYNIINHWNIYSDIAYQKFDFTTDLVSSPATAELKHEDKSSIGVGFRYWF